MRELVRDRVEPSTSRLVQVLNAGDGNPASDASNARVVAAIESLFSKHRESIEMDVNYDDVKDLLLAKI